jgi:UrcA family protein
MNIPTKNPIRIALAVALFAALTAGAQAADAPQLHVKYADLNVANAAGATVLYQRIRSAADQACGVPGTRDLGRLTAAKACAAHAVAQAVTAVNAPALTSIHQVKIGATSVTRLAAIR